jgi:hypothetical protein
MTKTRSQKTEGGIGDDGHGAHACVAPPTFVPFAPFMVQNRSKSSNLLQATPGYSNLLKTPRGGYGPDIAAQCPCRFQWPAQQCSPTGAIGLITSNVRLCQPMSSTPPPTPGGKFASIRAIRVKNLVFTFIRSRNAALRVHICHLPANLCQPMPSDANLCHTPGGLYLMNGCFCNIHAGNREKMMPVCVCVRGIK